MRRVRGSVVMLVGVLGLCGCAVFKGTPTASQRGTIGHVAVTFTVCASITSDPAPAGSCANDGNSGEDASSEPSQLWIGFRVPDGTSAPSAFRSSRTGPDDTGPQLQFERSSAYTNELQRLAPAAKGQAWIGYTSQYVAYDASSGDQNFTATADLGLPRAKSGKPFAGPFRYQVVVGGRQYDTTGSSTTPSAGASIDCETSATGGYGIGPTDLICVDASSPSTLGANATLATRDAGIVAGPRVSVRPGATARARFRFDYAGASPKASFRLTATTTVPGARAWLSISTIRPTHTESKAVTASVQIPSGTRPGTYRVRLVARLANGQSRTAVDTIRIR